MHIDARNEPRPTDIDDRLMAYRRRKADQTRVPALLQKQSPSAPNIEDFSRKLKISNSSTPAASKQPQKLFNPDTDPIPLRRVSEPESVPGSSATLYPPRPTVDRGQRQLFDHRKDDPVKFSAHSRPPHTRPSPTTHKSSGDYVSASSISSYAPSVASSITLSSTTDSSTSSALFDGQSKPHEQSSNALSTQLKLLYREITGLESRIKQEDTQDDSDEPFESRILIKGRESETTNEIEKDKWNRRVADHKKLADIIHELLLISLAPTVPASLRQIPTKYNIIVRLWTFAFHRLLESLRRASFTSPVALEHLQDFIYYAYTFYTSLLENETTLKDFKTGWLEALGDLARYRMAVAAIITGGVGTGTSVKLTEKAIMDAAISNGTDLAQSTDSLLPLTTAAAAANAETSTDREAHKARIDDSPSPSVGVAAARLLDVEPEKELWRSIAREWYAAGLSEQPGTGKLHHHLGLLSREVEGEELRAIYHFVKSMTALHPFSTARESVLPLWSVPTQTRRFLPDAVVSDLFVLLHGMLFTNIQLDDFHSVLSRFIERLELDGAEERQWIMMAIVNISAILEYGRSGGILRRASGIAARDSDSTSGQAATKVVAKKSANAMDIDQDQHDDEIRHSPRQSSASSDFRHEDLPTPFLLALQLTFSMLSHVLHRPLLKSSDFMQTDVNPYLTVVLTFLLTLIKHPLALQILERAVPWEDLAAFLTTVPKKYGPSKQGVIPSSTNTAERGKWITNGCAPPLPEDWCLRGMEWERRRVFERGYWKSDSITSELDVLAKGDHFETTDGKIEDDDSVYGEQVPADGRQKSVMSQVERRWVRVLRCGVGIAEIVDGFSWSNVSKSWKVQGNLLEKVRLWRELDQAAKQEEEERKSGRRWADESMDVDEDDAAESEESEDDENDSEEVKALKARRRYLRSLLQPVQQDYDTSIVSNHRPRQTERKPSRPPLCVVPGYTILVIDTNILLSSLSLFASLIESLKWTIVIPLPVIMELDGLSSNTSALGEAAQSAAAYIFSHIRTHGLSLKVQTSKGNYLTTLAVRTEQVDFSNQGADWGRCMDDLILKAAIWQDEHWVDRSQLLGQKNEDGSPGAAKVVLLSLDRNLRLKARSRQLLVASEKDLAAILAKGK
ncbi:hypothetical protein JOM56_003760 [Amanita muscaria]